MVTAVVERLCIQLIFVCLSRPVPPFVFLLSFSSLHAPHPLTERLLCVPPSATAQVNYEEFVKMMTSK